MAFKIDFDTSSARSNIDTLGRKVTEVKNKVDALNRSSVQVAKVGESSRALRKQVSQMSVGMQTLQKSTKSLGDQITGVSLAQTELGKRGIHTNTVIKKSTKGMGEFRKEMASTSKGAAALRAGMYATGTHFGAFTAQTIAAATGTYLVVKSFASMVQVGAQFEQSMTRANAVMNNYVRDSLQLNSNASMLENQVRTLGKETVFTVGEVAEGLVFLGMAGLSASESSKALKPVLNIASIGLIDMAKAADIATNIMLGFGKTAVDLVDIVDVMSVAITSSNMDMLQLGNALSYVAPVAVATNNSLKDTVAILELFHNVGIKSSRAGTSLRRAMINLTKPTDKVQVILTKLNVALSDQTGKMRPLVNIMRQFVKSNADVADITTIFGARAAPAMIAFYRDLQQEVKGATSEFQNNRNELDASTGQAEILRSRIEATLSGDWRKLVSALSELSLQIYDNVLPGLKSVVFWSTALIKSLSGGAITAFISSLALFAFVLYPLPLIMRALSLRLFTYSVAARKAAASTFLLSKAFRSMGKSGIIITVLTTALALFYILRGDEISQTKTKLELDSKANDRKREEINLRSKLAGMITKDIAKKKEELRVEADIYLEGKRVAEVKLRMAKDNEKETKATIGRSGGNAVTRGISQGRLIRNKAEVLKAKRALVLATLDADSAVKKLKITTDTLNISQDMDKDRIKRIKAIIAKTEELFKTNKQGLTTYKDLLATQKQGNQETLDDIALRKASGSLTVADAASLSLIALKDNAVKTKAIYKKSIDDLNTQVIEAGKKYKEFLKKAKADGGKGIGEGDAKKRFEIEKKLREQLDKAKAKGTTSEASGGKAIAAAKRGIVQSATSVRNGLRSQLQIENDSYKSSRTALMADLDKKGNIKAENRVAEIELTKQHNLKLAELALAQVSTVTQPLGEYFQTSYNMAFDSAKRQWDLTKEAESRKEKFQEAARNSQNAGDREYYQGIANQYKNYEKSYKSAAVEADRIARKRFEQNKTAQIANTIINTSSAVIKMWEQGGLFAGPAAAAMAATGLKAVSAIRAQEYSSPGGGDAFSGSFGGLPSSADSRGDSIADSPRTSSQGTALQIFIEGAITEDMINDVVLPVIKDGINDRDIVLISGNGADSAQLSALRDNQR